MSDEILQSPEGLYSVVEDTSSDLPEALRVPEKKVSFLFLVALTLGNMSWLMVGLPILALLLPMQISILDSVHKVALLGTILTVGGLAGVITPPLSGALSDRTTSRLGRRRPWMIAGALGVIVGFLIAIIFPSILALAIAWIVANSCGNILYASMTFVLPDRVPERQRGTASAFTGLAAPVGQILGLFVVTAILSRTGGSINAAYIVLIAIVVVLGGGFILFYHEPQLPQGVMPPFQLGEFLKGFWISPRAYPDFAYAWITRFLLFLAFFTVSSFTFFYLTDVVRYTQIFPGQTVAEGITFLTSISTVCLVIATLLGGLVSDHFQRRKPFVMAASLIMGLGLLTLGLFHTWPAVLVATVLQGFGFGAYLTVDIALVTQVLPRAEKRGQDLGLMVIALNIAQFVAPTVGALIVGSFASNVVAGYSTLYIVAAVLTLLATVLVLPIKSVR